MQLQTPQHNVYGVTFPGSPMVIIGFNDSCSWGVTNASRDVKDYYSIRFKDDKKESYWYNGEWKKADLHIDTIKIKGQPDLYDTVAYTVYGPVQYDASFSGSNRSAGYSNLALHWKALEPSNEVKTFYQLNRMKNYGEYLQAIQSFSCPGQNFVFASKSGDIAIWQQGSFPAKWRRQGDFIMPGTDTTYNWQTTIQQSLNPNVVNPVRGFVSSANQQPADSTYPYYLGGNYDVYRGLIINRFLQNMNGITVEDMKDMQTNNYNVFAETLLPLLLQKIDAGALNNEEKTYLDLVSEWEYNSAPNSKEATVFQVWYDSLQAALWGDELATVRKPIRWPDPPTLVNCLKDSSCQFADNINTPAKETVTDVVTSAFKKAVPVIAQADSRGNLSWSQFKDAGIRHLMRLPQLSRFHLNTGGGQYIINATKQFHGPSWRMIVEMTDNTDAWGIYPGGQSGNPGSPYYDNFVDDWAKGKYHKLWIMSATEGKDKRVKGKITFFN
jgi:penicillin G amidase